MQDEDQLDEDDPMTEVAAEIQNFEEYTWLYHDTWMEPTVRWLLSTVPTTMILDDHDLRDDWNTSVEWRDRVTRTPWWRERVVGALWIVSAAVDGLRTARALVSTYQRPAD